MHQCFRFEFLGRQNTSTSKLVSSLVTCISDISDDDISNIFLISIRDQGVFRVDFDSIIPIFGLLPLFSQN